MLELSGLTGGIYVQHCSGATILLLYTYVLRSTPVLST